MTSSKSKPCCVPGCYNRKAKRHSIVKNKQCRKIWLERINSNKLDQYDDAHLTNLKICEAHFENICIQPSGRLRKFSLPTLNLPGYKPTGNDSFRLMPTYKKYKNATLQKLKEAGMFKSSSEESSDSASELSVTLPTKKYGRKRLLTSDVSDTRLLVKEFQSSSRDTEDLIQEPMLLENVSGSICTTEIKVEPSDDEVSNAGLEEIEDKGVSKTKCCGMETEMVVCVNCLSILHKTCLKTLQNVKIISGGKVMCCVPSKKPKEKYSSDLDTFMLRNTYLKEDYR